MLNRDIYQKDPSKSKLVNEGVVSVNDESQAVLRYELETFVCDGQYSRGLERILDTYLRNLGEAQQPAVWVSGFYGSGKSHLVKMLRALWVDTAFSDGATARAVADLPTTVKDLLKELSIQALRTGGIHAASGTLTANAGDKSVRLAILRIVQLSVGLPELYPAAKFALWLKAEGIYDLVRRDVEAGGHDWAEELDQFYVAEGLHQALAAHKPQVFSSPSACVDILLQQFPMVEDVSNGEMVKVIRQALSKNDKFPLTLVVLDEVQQYIGDNSQRSMDVQEAVEACCKGLGSRLLFIGTGQTAVNGTPNLKRLEGRFSVRVELSDTDVDAVIRKVVLAKKPTALAAVSKVMDDELGEISRHLTGTGIGHRQADQYDLARDYPLLPVRRRFWNHALRVLDSSGTDGQLRNQLKLVHRAVQTNLDRPLGNVIPTDYLYFESANTLLQSSALPRAIHEKTMAWSNGNPDERLLARAVGLIFLIGKLSGDKDLGIKADPETLADLLVEDLEAGSVELRQRLPILLENQELTASVIMRIGGEYRIQTQEGTQWLEDLNNSKSLLANEPHKVTTARDEQLRKCVSDQLKKLPNTQGVSKAVREYHLDFGQEQPKDSQNRVVIWVRDSWSADENSVLADARAAGNDSSIIFVYIPGRSTDELHGQLREYLAATRTLELRGVPDTADGKEARKAMETRQQVAFSRVNELLAEMVAGARVFQGGGIELPSDNLHSMASVAISVSYQRLYPQFGLGDHSGWSKVYNKASQGAVDALREVGYNGEVGQNLVCKAILGYVGAGKQGAAIRATFEGPPYGWTGDTIDGAIQVLLNAGLLKAQGDGATTLQPKTLERKNLGKVFLRPESVAPPSTAQRIQIRKLLQAAGVVAKPEEESVAIPLYLDRLTDMAIESGGEAPKPLNPNTDMLASLRLSSGNELLAAIYQQRDLLGSLYTTWSMQAEAIKKRWPGWLVLLRLTKYATEVPDGESLLAEVQAVSDQRLLLQDPDPVARLTQDLCSRLRAALKENHAKYTLEYDTLSHSLFADPAWIALNENQRSSLRIKHKLEPATPLKVGTTEELLAELAQSSVASWVDRTHALANRFSAARLEAITLVKPTARAVSLPKRTLENATDIERWVTEVRTKLEAAIAEGPIVIG